MTMKRSEAYISAFLCISMVMPTMAYGTPMPKYLQFFQQPHGKNYAFNTLLIDMTQVIRGLGLLVYYRTTHKKKNLDCAINAIQDQLKAFETLLLQEERNALTALKNKFNMSDEIWNACLTDIQELKDIYKNAMHQLWPEAQTDKHIPAHLADTVTALLLKNNINPQSITIQMAKEPKGSTLMHVRSIIDIGIDPKDNKLIIVKHYLPPILEIFPAIKKQLNNQQKITALCAHEVQHIIEHHVLTQVVLETYLDHYYAIDNKTLAGCPEFQKFIQVREAQAELLSAIKDPTIAHCLSYYRADTYYPNYLYEDHYYNLSNVDMLWKIDAWLTWCQQFNIANTKDDVMTKMHNLADSFKQLVS